MSLPSVLLHDHLDGGVRPGTLIDLASKLGYGSLPGAGVEGLAAWFDQSGSGSLETYLAAFEHTIALMQTWDAIERIAYEAAIDLSSDGVVYMETRLSPPQHTAGGLGQEAVVEAVASGLAAGSAETGIRWGIIIDALRQSGDSSDVATLATRCMVLGVVGFDLAGPEAGYPPDVHMAACRQARESGLRLTIHAGEAAGRHAIAYLASAMDRCGAERIGHGVELIQDCVIEGGEIIEVGPVAERVRSRRIPLEMCPKSNMATGRLEPGEHPIGALHRAGFNVTINTDNRLMSNTSMGDEFDIVTGHHAMTVDDLAVITRRSLDAAFCPWSVKQELWEEAIAPAYRQAGAPVEMVWA